MSRGVLALFLWTVIAGCFQIWQYMSLGAMPGQQMLCGVPRNNKQFSVSKPTVKAAQPIPLTCMLCALQQIQYNRCQGWGRRGALCRSEISAGQAELKCGLSSHEQDNYNADHLDLHQLCNNVFLALLFIVFSKLIHVSRCYYTNGAGQGQCLSFDAALATALCRLKGQYTASCPYTFFTCNIQSSIVRCWLTWRFAWTAHVSCCRPVVSPGNPAHSTRDRMLHSSGVLPPCARCWQGCRSPGNVPAGKGMLAAAVYLACLLPGMVAMHGVGGLLLAQMKR